VGVSKFVEKRSVRLSERPRGSREMEGVVDMDSLRDVLEAQSLADFAGAMSEDTGGWQNLLTE
jgi:hypothetical protein